MENTPIETATPKSTLNVVIDEVNRVEIHIWALIIILAGAVCYCFHEAVAGNALVVGGMAIFQKPSSQS